MEPNTKTKGENQPPRPRKPRERHRERQPRPQQPKGFSGRWACRPLPHKRQIPGSLTASPPTRGASPPPETTTRGRKSETLPAPQPARTAPQSRTRGPRTARPRAPHPASPPPRRASPPPPPGHRAQPTTALTVPRPSLRTAPAERARFAAGAVTRRAVDRPRLAARRPQHARRPFSSVSSN